MANLSDTHYSARNGESQAPMEICKNDAPERRRPILLKFRSIGKPGGYGLRNRW